MTTNAFFALCGKFVVACAAVGVGVGLFILIVFTITKPVFPDFSAPVPESLLHHR
jgi:hypothetical protein